MINDYYLENVESRASPHTYMIQRKEERKIRKVPKEQKEKRKEKSPLRKKNTFHFQLFNLIVRMR